MLRTNAAAEPSKQKYIVLVVLDGFRPDYREFVSTPNIDSLMKKGVTYRNSWVAQLMNVTPPGHVGIST
ncbi:MAG: alkaline phosphatase family protein [Coprothermobacterota bacterium]|nr:alkaline phosphatase family protein [Coprothermobacterota bacterium]